MFEWKPEYSVQIPKIDVQHQRLFALAAELHAAMAEGKGKTVLEQSLARLVDYTKVHFAAEEEFMGKYGYPEAGRSPTACKPLEAASLPPRSNLQALAGQLRSEERR